MKPIRLSEHAKSYIDRRGFTVDEVEQAIRGSVWEPAVMGRQECRKDFTYGREWNGKYYETKRVRPVFVEETDEILVVPIYTYFF